MLIIKGVCVNHCPWKPDQKKVSSLNKFFRHWWNKYQKLTQHFSFSGGTYKYQTPTEKLQKGFRTLLAHCCSFLSFQILFDHFTRETDMQIPNQRHGKEIQKIWILFQLYDASFQISFDHFKGETCMQISRHLHWKTTP